MEEQQIQEFVHRVVMDQEVRSALALDPVKVLERAGYTPRVVDILMRLVPCLAFEQQVPMGEKWWHA